MKLPRTIFITGTDTGVGKTIVTAAVCSCIKSSGKRVAAMKPIQTGTDTQKTLDIEFVYKVLDEEFLIDDVCPYRFTKPLSPKLASEVSGKEIHVNDILSAYKTLEEKFEYVVIEGAGGILAPVKNNYFIVDLINEMESPVIIVTRPALGTINHTLLTIESAKNKGLSILGIIVNKYPIDPDDSELTNPDEIASISGLPILGIIPEIQEVNVEYGHIGSIRQDSKKYLSSLFGGKYHFKYQSSTSKLLYS